MQCLDLPPVQAASLAYVIYTSGSTGKPKGVMVNHENILNTLYFLESRYPVGPEDVYLLKTNYVFDVSLSELFGWFVGCGHLVILSPQTEKSPAELIDCVEVHQITHINFVPSMLSVFMEEVCEHRQFLDKCTLKYLMVAGEAFPKSLVEKCLTYFSGRRPGCRKPASAGSDSVSFAAALLAKEVVAPAAATAVPPTPAQ